MFTTQENDRIDACLSRSGHKDARRHWMHALKSNWAWVGVTFLFTRAFVFVGLYWGLPWASKEIAFELPVKAIQAISSGTLQTLDRLVFEPNGLPVSRQQALRRRFQSLLPDDPGQLRCGGDSGSIGFHFFQGSLWIPDCQRSWKVLPDVLECGGNLTSILPESAVPEVTAELAGEYRLAAALDLATHPPKGVAARGKRRRRGACGTRCSGFQQTPLVSSVVEVRCNRTALQAHSKAVRNP